MITSVLVTLVLILVSAWREPISGFVKQSKRPEAESQQSPIGTPDFSGLSRTKVAAIVENRVLGNLIPIVLHFSSVLGPEWPIYIFTKEANFQHLNQSAPWQRGLSAGTFRLIALPKGVELKTHESVSEFFTMPWFWEQLSKFDRVLMFQTDSIICSNSEQRAEDFLKYDFVGAPINTDRLSGSSGFNGGLSIRNVKMSLEIVKAHDWKKEKFGDHNNVNLDYEDQWFWHRMTILPANGDDSPGAELPSTAIAQKFSVESLWYDKPLGYHQANTWQSGQLGMIYKWCPEYKMCTEEGFRNSPH